MLKKSLNFIFGISLLILGSLWGCGDQKKNNNPELLLQGIVIDGPVALSTILVRDSNDELLSEGGELISAQSDEEGNFELRLPLQEGSVTYLLESIQGIDTGTNSLLEDTDLTAVGMSTAVVVDSTELVSEENVLTQTVRITPLTSLVAEKIRQTPNLSFEDALEETATQLGLEVDEVLDDPLQNDKTAQVALALFTIARLSAAISPSSTEEEGVDSFLQNLAASQDPLLQFDPTTETLELQTGNVLSALQSSLTSETFNRLTLFLEEEQGIIEQLSGHNAIPVISTDQGEINQAKVTVEVGLRSLLIAAEVFGSLELAENPNSEGQTQVISQALQVAVQQNLNNADQLPEEEFISLNEVDQTQKAEEILAGVEQTQAIVALETSFFDDEDSILFKGAQIIQSGNFSEDSLINLQLHAVHQVIVDKVEAKAAQGAIDETVLLEAQETLTVMQQLIEVSLNQSFVDSLEADLIAQGTQTEDVNPILTAAAIALGQSIAIFVDESELQSELFEFLKEEAAQGAGALVENSTNVSQQAAEEVVGLLATEATNTDATTTTTGVSSTTVSTAVVTAPTIIFISTDATETETTTTTTTTTTLPVYVTVSTPTEKTSESGDQVSFTVVLDSQPTSDVTIPLSTGDSTEGTITQSSLTFSSDNWNAPQSTTVTGVDDSIQDGDQTYRIVLGEMSSSDSNFNGLDPDDVEIINVDNDTASITVTDVSNNTTEGGGQGTFTIVLNSQPSADVTISLSSSDTTEGTITQSSVTFTSDNWNAKQTITVTGVDDSSIDGNQTFQITTGAATSNDSDYNDLDPADAAVTNTDDDTASVVTSSLDGTTTEGGGQATFTIALGSQPTADVAISLTSSATTEGTISVSSLIFTADNWNAAQKVTVTGVDDSVADGNQIFQIQLATPVSDDTNYSGLDSSEVSVTNTDNDSAGFTVSAISGDITEGGTQATFTVVLNSQPTANVGIALSSLDTTEGTISGASLTFTSSNWDAQQQVTVTGVDDSVADGNQSFRIQLDTATSGDANYSGLDPDDVTVTNIDNDSPGVTVSTISGNTTEAGGQATFTVVLTSEPTADVTISLSNGDSSEGAISPSTLTFTSSNWDASQTVTVTGQDDSVQDGNQSYLITLNPATSSDTNYSGLDPDDVTVTNTDNDSAGITVSSISGNSTEDGGSATFTVVLNSEPTANVTISLSNGDSSEGALLSSSLTFTSSNWNAAQTVTVTGQDDSVQDGNQSFLITLNTATSSDTNYSGLDPDDVNVTNTDNDSAEVTVSSINGNTTEAGGQATFTVVLTSEPTADVAISLSNGDSSEGAISLSSLTFTSSDWNTAQTVTVTGQDDSVADGNQSYLITLNAATSSDGNYSGLDPNDVSVTNIDNDSAGFTVSTISGNTTEIAGTGTFTVVLTSEPTADVTISLTNGDSTEGALSASSLTFTSANWDIAQTVTVTGQDDSVADGNQSYLITLETATSSDTNYNGLDPSDVSVTNTDDDTAGFTVSTISGNITEAGGTATFTVVLTSQPTADVSISLTNGDSTEGSLSTASLTFTSSNWDTTQTVTVTGQDDSVDDGNQSFLITLETATSSDANYNGLDPNDVSVTNTDNDTAGFNVSTITIPLSLQI